MSTLSVHNEALASKDAEILPKSTGDLNCKYQLKSVNMQQSVSRRENNGTDGVGEVEQGGAEKSLVESEGGELCLSREWPITELTDHSPHRKHTTLAPADPKHNAQQRAFSFLISEYVSVNQNIEPHLSMPSKIVKYLHRKRLKERGFRMTNKKLGEGGFGAVYKVYYNEDKCKATPLACKIMLMNKESSDGDKHKARKEKNKDAILQAYSNEIYVMKSSCHRNIVSIKQNFIYSRVVNYSDKIALRMDGYIVMEYAMGTLNSKLKKQGPFGEESSRNYCRQIASGLHHLHDRGIAHRDLKLGNILLTSSENCQEIVKLTDFGLSRLVNSEEYGLVRFTKAVGTLPYMSPQIIACYILANNGHKSQVRSYDPFKADVWALGVCLYLMLAKVPPFDNPPSSKAQRVSFARHMLARQLRGQWHLPPESQLTLSPSCQSLLTRLLEPINRKRLNIYDVIKDSWIIEGNTT